MDFDAWFHAPASGRWLDLSTWPRRDTYEFFLSYEQPLTSVCATVPVGALLDYCKAQGHSFFLASWYLALRALSSVENLRMRLREEGVYVHERLYLSTTVLRSDETFGFCHIPYTETFAEFSARGRHAMALTLARTQPLDLLEGRDDAVYGSTLPWLRMTGITHAHRVPNQSSVPKLVFGKYGREDGTVTMPVALEVHHALCDGLHLARFYQGFEALLTLPEESLSS